MANHDANPSQGFRATEQQLEWGDDEREYWRENWSSRPYVSADRDFGYYEPGYRYGAEAARKYLGKQWRDVEEKLRNGWKHYEHRNNGEWEHMQDAARDAWERASNRPK